MYYITYTTITMSAGMTLFLELEFEPLAIKVPLFLVGLVLAFSGVWLINSLPTEEGEGGAKVAGVDAEQEEPGVNEDDKGGTPGNILKRQRPRVLALPACQSLTF